MATEPRTGYIGLAVETDADEIAQEAFDYIESRLPGWEPGEANIEVILIETQAQEQAVERDLASQTADDIFKSFGALVGIVPTEATAARGSTTWTMGDDAGYTVPAGRQIALVNPSGEQVGFQTLEDFTVPNGSTIATDVTVEAIEEGAEGSGLSGTATLIDALAFVADGGIVVNGVTTGGVDAEETTAYLARLALRLQLQSTAAILPRDFEILALDVAGAARALALDGYQPLNNLLTANQSSVEVDTTGFATDTNVGISRSTAQAAHGSASLALTSVASGEMAARTLTGTNGVPVIAGRLYTARAEFRSAVSARSVRVDIAWYTAAGALISTTVGVPAADATSGWTLRSVSAQAPATAAFAAIRFVVLATGGASEVHYVDRIQLRENADTTDWVIGKVVAYDQARTIAVAVIDEAGQPLPTPTKNEIDALLQAQREVNFVVQVIDPTYTTIDVTATVRALPGYDTGYVESSAEAVLSNYLHPAIWGTPIISGEIQAGAWANRTAVYYNDVIAEADRADGVDRVISLTINGGSADVLLGGAAPLTIPGTISITVEPA